MANKWFEETFLPSLFEKYQNRDKEYTTILISERQAIMFDRVKCEENYNTRMGSYKRYFWKKEGRDVYLERISKYYKLSFGLTEAEEKALKEKDHAEKRAKKLENIKKAKERGSRAIEEYRKCAKIRYEDAIEMLKDEGDEEYIEFYNRQKKEAAEELALM